MCNGDLNEFFKSDSILYAKELLGKTYCFTLNEDVKEMVCAFTVFNHAINTNRLPNSRKKKVNKNIPSQKYFENYPAVLIGRLGVDVQY